MDKNLWYFVGLWLGDGAKDATSITSADVEIIEFIKTLVKTLNLKLSIYKSKSKAFELNISSKKCRYCKQVHQYTLQGVYIKTYNSIKEAALDNNIKYSSNISHCSEGKHKHCGGYKWTIDKIVKNNTLRVLLEKLNLINNKHVPKELFTESTENIKHFLAGFIDSDGTLDYSTIKITQKYEHIIDGLIEVCHILGYKCRKKVFYVKNQPYYAMFIKGDLTDLPVLLDRKRPKKPSKIPKAMKEYYG